MQSVMMRTPVACDSKLVLQGNTEDNRMCIFQAFNSNAHFKLTAVHFLKYYIVFCREGVQFMFECVGGLRDFSKVKDMDGGMVEDDNKPKDEGCFGCILADDMVSTGQARF